MNSGPVAQFKPIDSSGACWTEAKSASIAWPASIVPIGSIVTDPMIGTRQPTCGKRLLGADQAGFEVARVLGRLDQQRVRPSREQPDRLGPVMDDHLVEGGAARHGDGLGRRTHGARDESGPVRRRKFLRGVPSDLGGEAVDLERAIGQAVFREDEGRRPERVGLDHVGARREVLLVHPQDDVRARAHEVLVASLELLPAEVGRGQVLPLEPRSRGAVQDQDALRQHLPERFGALALSRRIDPPGVTHQGSDYRPRPMGRPAGPPGAATRSDGALSFRANTYTWPL